MSHAQCHTNAPQYNQHHQPTNQLNTMKFTLNMTDGTYTDSEILDVLVGSMKVINTWASCDESNNESRDKAMCDIEKKSRIALDKYYANTKQPTNHQPTNENH